LRRPAPQLGPVLVLEDKISKAEKRGILTDAILKTQFGEFMVVFSQSASGFAYFGYAITLSIDSRPAQQRRSREGI